MSDEEEEEYAYEEDEDEDEEYEYDDDDGCGDGSGGAAGSGGGGGGGLSRAETMGPEGVRVYEAGKVGALLTRHVAEVSDLLGLTPDAAQILCTHLRWVAPSRLAERWFENSDKLSEEAGLPSMETEQGFGTSAEPFSCSICSEELPSTEGFALGCGHRFCRSCWSAGLSVHVASVEALRTSCFGEGCKMVVPPSVFKLFLGDEDYAKYERWSTQNFIECSKNLQTCLEPRCESVAFCGGGRCDTYTEVACRCGKRWCFNCCAEDHRPASCDQVRNWNNKSNDQDLTEMYIRANTKKCPKCDQKIQKDEGCQHMKCTNCGYHFCWLCLGAYADHSDKTGGFYACNKFEARVKAEGRSAEEQTALKAARQLRNYEMAFERHLNHTNALDLAQKELHKQVEEALQSPSFEGLDDIHQLRFAVDQVIASRRVLAWSYVFKYFQFEDDSLERELTLFEGYQGKLEHMTEELQTRLSELETASAHSIHSSSRGLSAEEPAPDEVFSQWRQGVVHLMGAVRSFSNQVVDFANNAEHLFDNVEWEAREQDDGLDDKPKPVWSWKDDSQTWNPFSDENIRIIEEAHQSGQNNIIITSAGRRYRMDLQAMRQTNLETHGSRIIRRTMESGAAWSCDACSYHNAPGADACVMCARPRNR